MNTVRRDGERAKKILCYTAVSGTCRCAGVITNCFYTKSFCYLKEVVLIEMCKKFLPLQWFEEQAYYSPQVFFLFMCKLYLEVTETGVQIHCLSSYQNNFVCAEVL